LIFNNQFGITPSSCPHHGGAGKPGVWLPLKKHVHVVHAQRKGITMNQSAAVKQKVPFFIFDKAEQQAAKELGIILTEQLVLDVRRVIKEKTKDVLGSAQYYVIIDDATWKPHELDKRMFACVRLIYLYKDGSGNSVWNAADRIENLKAVALRLAEKKKLNLPAIPTIQAR
jgi:hypothetical protein